MLEFNTSLLKLVQSIEKGAILRKLLQEVSITMLLKPSKNVTEKENYMSISLKNADVKTLSKYLQLGFNSTSGRACTWP